MKRCAQHWDPPRRLVRALSVAVSGTLLVNGVALAAPVVSTAEETNTTMPYVVSTVDLINGLAPAAESNLGTWMGTEGTNADPSVLTNGQYGPQGGVTDWKSATFTISNSTAPEPSPTILIYNLDLVSSPLGYDITGINTYSGWADQNRNQQHYQVSYATVDDPATFLSLVTFHSTEKAGSPSNRKVSISISDLTNVAAIKFDFSGSQSFNYTGYRELDVIGGASIPEPVSLGALPVSGWFLVMGRRRRR